MPQLDISTFPPQLIWLLITFVALYLVVWKTALPRISDIRDSRRRRIEDDLSKTESLREEAAVVLAELEKSHADAAFEAQDLKRKATLAISASRLKLQEETATRVSSIIQEAENRISAERAETQDAIPIIAKNVTRSVVQRLIGVEIDENEALMAVEATIERER